jgi:CBS domain-containing protein
LEDTFERLPIHWLWWPALGGLGVGLGGLVEPRALGVGYDVIRDLLTGHLVVQAVVTLLVVKALIWLVALSSGTSGGVLAPLLILGGAMGWLVGQVLPGDPGFWALLGMAAMLGGTMRSPLTSVIFAIELTGDWRMLAPLLAASVAAYATTVLLLKRSILTEKIARRGRHITREYGVDPYELVRVGEVMVQAVDTLPADMAIPDAVAVLQQGRHRVYPIVEASGRLVGMVTRADALAWRVEGGLEAQTVAERASDAALPVAHPDEVVARVVDLMLATGQGRIPVTDPATGCLVGLLARKDLLQIHATASRAEDDRQAYYPAGRRT